MSGHVGDLSPQQTHALEKFREQVKDLLKPKEGDFYLLRWLRARDFDVKKAEEMLKDALAWRKQIRADTILEEYEEPEAIQKFRTGGLCGYDKHGCPIYIDPYGLIDMKGLLRCVRKQDLVRKFVQVMETVEKMCVEQSAKRGKHIDEMVIVYDLNGVGLKHLGKASVDAFLTLVGLAESKYPETLRRVFVINSPKIFPIIWSIVKPILHENTAKKVHVLAGNYKAVLLKEIDAEQLPKCYGGTKTDPDGDPRCRNLICQGGMIPKEYYNQPISNVSMSTANVGRGSSVQIEYQVKIPNSLIRYEFFTEGYDISFGVFRKTSDEYQKAGEMETVLASERSHSHLVAEDGIVECSETGTYVFRFDNTYSWARSKKVNYNIEVLVPEEKVSDDEEYHMAQEDV